jgi:predicted aconitase
MAGNPFNDAKGEGMKLEICIALGPRSGIKIMNEDEITAEDRAEAVKENEERIRVAKEAEEEAAREAAAKEAEGKEGEGEGEAEAVEDE